MGISFVWPGHMSFRPWAGGAEVYTLSQINELLRRGIDARLVVYGTTLDSWTPPPGIPVRVLEDVEQLSELDDTLIFQMLPAFVSGGFRRQSYLIVHALPATPEYDVLPIFRDYGTGGSELIATGQFMAKHWQGVLEMEEPLPVVYPPIDSIFSEVSRPINTGRRRVLFAGRPVPSKGPYVLMASLHMPPLHGVSFELAALLSDEKTEDAAMYNPLVQAHPRIRAIPPRTSRLAMAELLAATDVVVVPSTSAESFGMIAAEAQHAGCRVVASNLGGLPETDCGGLLLVDAEDPSALARGVAEAVRLGPLTAEERAEASRMFTPAASVDALLGVIGGGIGG